MTPDPYQASGGGSGNPSDPGSWNRYAYTAGDPVNRLDATGLDYTLTCGEDSEDCGGYININQNVCITIDNVPNPLCGYDSGSSPFQVRRPFVPPPSYPIPTDVAANLLLNALNTALSALENNTQCADLFDIGGNLAVPTPETLLNALYTGGTAWGKIMYSAYGQYPGNVAAATSGGFGLGVTINLNNSTGGQWYDSTPNEQAAILLHELGHAYQFLFGSSTTQITNDSIAATGSEDASIEASEANQSLVLNKCNLH